jgi:hypothetical protein
MQVICTCLISQSICSARQTAEQSRTKIPYTNASSTGEEGEEGAMTSPRQGGRVELGEAARRQDVAGTTMGYTPISNVQGTNKHS